MHTLKKILLSSVPKLILKMAAFALTSELDHFDIETSFENFVKETQQKLLSMPDIQADDTVPVTYDCSSFMNLKFDAQNEMGSAVFDTQPADQTEMGPTVFDTELADQTEMGATVFDTEHQGKDLLFQDLAEEDVATAVVYQDTKFSEQELLCLEVLEGGFKFQQPQNEGFIEENYNYSEHAFSYTEDGVTVVKNVVPSVLSLKKAMACKQAIRTAIDSRLRQELEDFSIPKKGCKKRSIIMQGWRSNDPNNPFAKARDQFLDEIFDDILDISTRIENSEYGYLASKKRK